MATGFSNGTELNIEKEIENHFNNYEAYIHDDFLQIAYKYLSEKKKLHQIEYRFLCWLNYSKQYEIKIKPPYIPEIINISGQELENRYLKSVQRKNLYKLLNSFLEILQEKFSISNIQLIIGGSYLDTEKENPKDIDLVILLPKDSPDIHENFLYKCGQVPSGIDVKFLPANYSMHKFKAYSNLICLANKIMDKSELVNNNEFELRQIIQLAVNPKST